MFLLLMACTKSTDVPAGDSAPPADSDPSSSDSAPPECEELADPMADGLWAMGIHEAQKNECETDDGEGFHIHVGQDTMMEFTSDGTCLTAVSDPGSDQEMAWSGTQDADSIDITGTLVFEMGTCHLRVNAHITGDRIDDETVDYVMQTEFVVEDELSPDACSLLPWPIPCEQQWSGTGVKQ